MNIKLISFLLLPCALITWSCKSELSTEYANMAEDFNLSATIAYGGVLLSWDALDSDYIKRYDIYRSIDDSNQFNLVNKVNNVTTHYIDKDITNGHKYSYKVIAINNNNKKVKPTNSTSIDINTDPILMINNNEKYTSSRDVSLTIICTSAVQYILSDSIDFSGSEWSDFESSPIWTLEEGEGIKRVYLKVKYEDGEESNPVYDEILPAPFNPVIIIEQGEEYAKRREVVLSLNATGAKEMMIANDSMLTDAGWDNYTAEKTWELESGVGEKKIFAKFRNDFGIISDVVCDKISPQPINAVVLISSEAAYTTKNNVNVILHGSGENLKYKISEDSLFSGCTWANYISSTNINLSVEDGIKTVYAAFLNDFNITAVASDQIILDTAPPTAAFSVIPSEGITDETEFFFDASVSSDNGVDISNCSVRWDFNNDGEYDTDWGTEKIRYFQYKTGGGEKDIKLQIRDIVGNINETTGIVSVNTRPETDLTWALVDNVFITVAFDASVCSDYEDGENLTYRWDFNNDGNWDTDWSQNDTVQYQYQNCRDFSVALEVRDLAELSRVITKDIMSCSNVQIADETLTAIGDPLWTQWTNCRTQSIYLASEIDKTSGMTIDRIAYQIRKLPDIPFVTFIIKMKNTTSSGFTDTFQENLTTVYNQYTDINETGWFEFILEQPFQYDGSGNLLIEISFQNTQTGGEGYMISTQKSNARTLHDHENKPYTLRYLPNIRLYETIP